MKLDRLTTTQTPSVRLENKRTPEDYARRVNELAASDADREQTQRQTMSEQDENTATQNGDNDSADMRALNIARQLILLNTGAEHLLKIDPSIQSYRPINLRA